MCHWDAMFPAGHTVQQITVNIRGHDRDVLLVRDVRPNHALDEKTLCFHGTALSNAFSICRTGFKAGTATHLGKTGVFCIASQHLAFDLSLESGFEHARDRCKNWRCTEWQQFRIPSAWSASVVLAFHHDKKDLTACEELADATKYVIRRPPGTFVTTGFFSLLFDRAEFLAWRRLHRICELEFNSNCVVMRTLYGPDRVPIIMCGGKESDPFHWCRAETTMPSSCGRTCPIPLLQDRGWMCAKNRAAHDKIWRCPVCWPTVGLYA